MSQSTCSFRILKRFNDLRQLRDRKASDGSEPRGGRQECLPSWNASRLRLAALLGVCVAFLVASGVAMAADNVPAIEEIDIVHFSHTDYGFTDHPAVCRELQRRYLDIALDAVLARLDRPEAERFVWTAETIVAVDDWWQAASPERRALFLKAVESGRLEVGALPHNQTPTLSGPQWQTMLHWLPEELWQRLRPRVALQNDVNGFPRAGAVALLDRGIRHLLSGINEDSGGAPMARPTAFWWKMPDGRRLFVYLNYSYPAGYWFFEPVEWRRGPVPRAADTRFRLPRSGDFLRTDEASLRLAHKHLSGRLRELESGGYRWPLLVLSITNQWRIDNDPPLPLLADFVGAWNRLGLKPRLRLSPVREALERLEQRVGGTLPVHQGEWTDWWANGAASGPREVAASREAKRLLAAAQSPLFGPMDDAGRQTVARLYRDLCLFDEHTWGAANSIALPYAIDTLGQFNEKAALAYRPLALAEWLLSQRVRSKLIDEGEGLFVANAARAPVSGWITMPVTCLREDYRSVEDPAMGTTESIVFDEGLRPFTRPESPEQLSHEDSAATFPDRAPRQVARFWVEGLPAGSVRKLVLGRQTIKRGAIEGAAPKVDTDAQGWPASASWQGMKQPLFSAGLGELASVQVRGFAGRWVAKDVWAIQDAGARDKARQQHLEQTAATAKDRAQVEDRGHTTLYTQRLAHPRLKWCTRQLEIWRRQPRARLTVRFYRNPSESPEALFVGIPLPCQGAAPRASNGGLPFVPYRDQLPGTCRDYFAIDGWLHYPAATGNWLATSRDAPLVTFGSPELLARRTTEPAELNRIWAMVFNSFWYTNFVADENGVMEFQFDLAWHERLDGPTRVADLAEALASEPSVLINPGLKEDPIVVKRLYRP